MPKELDWDDMGQAVAWRLRCRRLFAALTQEEVARVLGCTRNTVAADEANARQLPLWRLMAYGELYGCGAAHLIRSCLEPGGTEEEPD